MLFQAANHPAGAVDQHIGVGAQNSRRKDDAEADDGVYSHSRAHMEHHTAGGNISSFSEVFAGVRCANCNRKLERKAHRASKIDHPFTSSLLYTPAPVPAKDYFGF